MITVIEPRDRHAGQRYIERQLVEPGDPLFLQRNRLDQRAKDANQDRLRRI